MNVKRYCGKLEFLHLNSNNSQEEEQSEIIRINPAMKRHFELEIEMLQNAPKDEDKLRELLKLKKRQDEQEATRVEETQRLVSNIFRSRERFASRWKKLLSLKSRYNPNPAFG